MRHSGNGTRNRRGNTAGSAAAAAGEGCRGFHGTDHSVRLQESTYAMMSISADVCAAFVDHDRVMHHIAKRIVAACMVGAIQTAACAQAPAANAPPAKSAPAKPEAQGIDFAAVDKNGDRNVSKDEALLFPELASAFEMLDTDRDEAISPTEFSRWSRAGKVAGARPADPATAPGGSAGAQHMPDVK
jgi:hypothetical protein